MPSDGIERPFIRVTKSVVAIVPDKEGQTFVPDKKGQQEKDRI
jgi:hypothetical protein